MRRITSNHRRRTLAVFGVIACTTALLAGCGGSASHRSTITTSAARGGRQATAVKPCATSQACDTHVHLPASIDCEGGVTTNYSCTFAGLVRYARPRKSGLIVIRNADGTTTPVDCTVTTSAWMCRSRVSNVWVRGTGR
jgi:hypothetical protein